MFNFEGFGELHGIPGKFFNQCTGEELGRYHEGEWTECLRYIYDFVIPDDTVLTKSNCTASDTESCEMTVIALRGDEFLKSVTGTEKPTMTYDPSLKDELPSSTNLIDVGPNGEGNYIGDKTSDILNDGKPCVIQGVLEKGDDGETLATCNPTPSS